MGGTVLTCGGGGEGSGGEGRAGVKRVGGRREGVGLEGGGRREEWKMKRERVNHSNSAAFVLLDPRRTVDIMMRP